jgi:hypothetical protein
VIASDQIVSPLSIDVPDAVEMGITPMIDFSDNAPIAVGIIPSPERRPASRSTTSWQDCENHRYQRTAQRMPARGKRSWMNRDLRGIASLKTQNLANDRD